LVVQEQLGNQLLEAVDLNLQLATPALAIDLVGSCCCRQR
jgi:hypothetical protein